MKNCLLILVITFSFFFNSCSKHESNVATISCTPDFGFTDSSSKHPKAIAYQKMIDDLVKQGIPGITLMVEDSIGLWYGAKGKADIENNIDMQICHSTKIASITKLFTAVLAYKLIDEGKLKLNDKISNFIEPSIIKKLKNSEQATIADLMQHSSGINDFVFNPSYILYVFNNLDKEKNYEKLLSFSYNQPEAFAFGSKRQYNYTVNYILLAMCINKIMGKDHALVQREKIWTPLGLNHTFFRQVENIPWNTVAKGYFDYRKKGTLQELTQLFTGDGSGFTGIYSTSNDLRKFMNAVYRDQTLLSTSSFNSLTSSNAPNDSMSYAIGCRIYTVNVNNKLYHWYGHPGGEVNYASGAYYCPEKKATITFILNYGDAFDGEFSPSYTEFRRQILRKAAE
jgi:D-alanyl-D-alanine carboxypeptidase